MYLFHKFDFFRQLQVTPKPRFNRNRVSQKICDDSQKREILPKKRDSGLKHPQYQIIRFFTAVAEQRTPAGEIMRRGNKISTKGIK